MAEQFRRICLLGAASLASIVAFTAAWPGVGAAAGVGGGSIGGPMKPAPAPIYLVRDRGVTPNSASSGFMAVGTSAQLFAHLYSDGENLAQLEVIDATGGVVILESNGKATATGASLDPKATKAWVVNEFKTRARAVADDVYGNPACLTAKQVAQSRLDLPLRQGGRDLTLAQTLVEAEARITAMHDPANALPTYCLAAPSHKAGYLHNLWHRISGS
jgi:hypothetical protein